MGTNDFVNRRQALLKKIGRKNAAILFSSSEYIRNGDVHFPFRQQSNFFYFTGFSEPQCVAIFLPNYKQGQYILFNRPKDPQMERWLGPRAGQEGACEQFSADLAFDIALLDEKVLELLKAREKIFYDLGGHEDWDKQVLGWVTKLQEENRKNKNYPVALVDIKEIASEMRLIKSPGEIELMQAAAQKSAYAHRKVMEKCRPGLYEYELEALLNYELMVQGCRFSAYPAIVAGGKNACVLHYVENKDPLKAGDLVLIDAGGEYENYAADITRTLPVNGKFTQTQKAIYELVLATQLAVIEAIRPDVLWGRLHQIAVEKLAQGLVALGILPGPVTEVINKKSYQTYFMHGIGHWLGLDVHDVGAYKIAAQYRPLKPGMVLTVEPGLYLSPHESLEEKWWHIGVRIEDDVLVTATGHKVLSCDVPKTIQEVEGIMASG